MEVSFAGLTGGTVVVQGNEVLIYAVELQSTGASGKTVRIGGVPVPSEGITLTIADLTIPTGILAADFAGLNLYRSADGVLDGGDLFLKTITPVTIGGPMVLNYQGVANADREVPVAPASIFFLVSAAIAPGAIDGHAFTLSTAGNHIDMRDLPPGPPVDYTLGTAIAADNANFVIINATGLMPGSGSGAAAGEGVETLTPVPFDNPWLLGLLVGGYALWTILRRS